MFYKENNDFIGEQYESVQLKYSLIFFLGGGGECSYVFEAFSLLSTGI